ncbi:MAG: phosphorylase [Sphingomonas sp.]|uniref:phosphorylase family protein n=1 Tax=Sphingomonas sp. TaxID=28214 RepID=UPI0025D9E804|nr:phosphorylase [Sphingomonas sp.]MBY0283384.1 phosphorylase [Sphingomonas sp.]
MILIACGLQREAAILSRDGVLAIPGGGDAARLEAALEAATYDATMILSCGIGGALDPALKAGDLVLHLPPFVPSVVEGRAKSDVIGVSTALDTNGRGEFVERLTAALPHAHLGPIIGQDHIAATVAEKAALHAATGALAVDMESHIAARVAARHGLPFAAIRTISDTASETLPPAALVGMNPDGSMALGKVLLSLARDPAQLPALIRTGRSAEAAFRALGRVADAIAALNKA